MATSRELLTFSYHKEFKLRYQILHKLGEGAYSTVWAVLDLSGMKVVAMKMIVGEDWEGLIKEEFDNLRLLQRTIGHQTQCFPDIFERGFVDKDILLDYPDIPSEQIQKFMDENAAGYTDNNVAFMTMELYKMSIEDISIDKSILFEIILTLRAAHKIGYYHGDIAARNIMIKPVPYKRVYKVDGKEFIINNYYMPILIDWVNPRGDILTISDDLSNIAKMFSFPADEPDILNSEHFSQFRDGIIGSTSMVKYFESIMRKDDKINF